MYDFNEAGRQSIEQPSIDIDALSAALRQTVQVWAPRLFPNGRKVDDVLRLANISGDAPRKTGSCVVHLKGPHAGDWFEFDGNVGGGPLSTVAEATGLEGRALLSFAADLAGALPHRSMNSANPSGASSQGATEREIAFVLSRAAPLPGSHAEAYLRARGLDATQVEDLLFHPDLTHFQTRAGYPALVAIVRDVAGEPVGLHRTWLDPVAPAKAALDTPKKSIGTIRGGAIRLFPAASFVVIAEGIETALAIRTARPDLPVWAAIAAGHLAECQLPPKIGEVLIAADHDANGAGLKAADRLAERLVGEGRRVWIALPPQADTDFADVLATGGVSAVRTILGAAIEFVPKSPVLGASIIGEPPSTRRTIEETRKLYPLPRLENLLVDYRHASDGSVRVYKNAGKDRRGQDRWEAVATPFGPVARLRYLDQEEAFGLRVHVEAMDDRIRAVDFDRASLARVGASEIKAALFAAGLRTEGDGDSLAAQILKAADPDDEIVVVSRPGWHRVDGMDHPMFVTPGGSALSDDKARLELATAARFGSVARGTIEGWKAAVAAAAEVRGCPHFLLGVLCGFAGVVQSLAGLDSCGINLSGLSSSGKTTAQRLAVSPWTSPSIGAGLLQSMRSTENAIEVLAQAASGTVLALDELAHADGRAVARLIYAIAGGQGKARLTAGALLKQRYAWSTYAVLSSECSLEEKVRSDGASWIAGMAVRIVDVDVTDVDRTVPTELMRAIAGVEKHFGHAGPFFVAKLIERQRHHATDVLREEIIEAARKLAGPKSDAARLRAATCLALPLVAGRLAQDFDLLPWSIDLDGAIHWAWERFTRSSDADALAPDEQAIANIRAWIAERWDVTIKSVDTGTDYYDRKLNNREAVAWYDATAIYLPVQRLREASGETLKAQQIVKALIDRNLLAKRHSAKRATVRHVPQVGRIDAYALKRQEFGRPSGWQGPSLREEDDQ
ncbi:DUF927 domain-containing protein [Bradyrhizobium sp. HKCCYLS2038]|uniref:DUF927 domain-containing protein n=1 Tax=Bradyrhizobium sp. HKCCYLS2038 TaxID=3420764 RepID=UPI003EB9EEF6